MTVANTLRNQVIHLHNNKVWEVPVTSYIVYFFVLYKHAFYLFSCALYHTVHVFDCIYCLALSVTRYVYD